MKVTLVENYKSIYSLDDVARAKTVIKYQKDDSSTVSDYARYAVNEALKGTDDGLVRIIEATAETARNSRVWNLYGDDTETMDVWVKAIAKTYDGFIEIGAYLSDIWNTGYDYSYKDRMYIEYFTKRHN